MLESDLEELNKAFAFSVMLCLAETMDDREAFNKLSFID